MAFILRDFEALHRVVKIAILENCQIWRELPDSYLERLLNGEQKSKVHEIIDLFFKVAEEKGIYLDPLYKGIWHPKINNNPYLEKKMLQSRQILLDKPIDLSPFQDILKGIQAEFKDVFSIESHTERDFK